jgi:NADH-quinone oxidoreductase subunit M
VAAVCAAVGLVLATVYSLWLVQKVFHGELRAEKMSSSADLSAREATVFAALIVAIVWLGIYPLPVLRTVEPSLDALRPKAALTFVTLVGQPPP